MQILQKQIAGAPVAAPQRRSHVRGVSRSNVRVQAAAATEVKLNTKMSDEVRTRRARGSRPHNGMWRRALFGDGWQGSALPRESQQHLPAIEVCSMPAARACADHARGKDPAAGWRQLARCACCVRCVARRMLLLCVACCRRGRLQAVVLLPGTCRTVPRGARGLVRPTHHALRASTQRTRRTAPAAAAAAATPAAPCRTRRTHSARVPLGGWQPHCV
jgi:hypothetical protein